MEKLVSWVEIPAADFKRAIRFYRLCFGVGVAGVRAWCRDDGLFPFGRGRNIICSGFNPSKDGVLVSLNTGTDLDGTIRRIEENGGKIVQPKTKIEVENRGYFALFIDSEGNRVGLYGDK